MKFRSEDNICNAIIAVGYNRPNSLKRLLDSLNNSRYDDKVPLVISIDCSGNENVYSLANNYEWKHGNKYVIIQKERLGLKEHIYRCADLSKHFKSVTILEDDLLVSPYFYQYIKQTVAKYGDDENIAGISLYRNEHNGYNGLPLYFLNTGHDVFAYQSTSTWGETFTWQMWNGFRTWLSTWDENFIDVDMYQTIKDWKQAWSKYYEAYIILNNKYFIYPYLSVSTNNNDAGEHVTAKDVNNSWQTELLFGQKIFNLPDFDDLIRFDTYAQCELLKNIFNFQNLAIDLNGNRENINKYNYLLSVRNLNKKIIKSYGLRLRPIELNVLMEIPGNEIYLYDLTQNHINIFFSSYNRLLTDYYIREFDRKALLNKSVRLQLIHYQSWLQRFWRRLKSFISQ